MGKRHKGRRSNDNARNPQGPTLGLALNLSTDTCHRKVMGKRHKRRRSNNNARNPQGPNPGLALNLAADTRLRKVMGKRHKGRRSNNNARNPQGPTPGLALSVPGIPAEVPMNPPYVGSLAFLQQYPEDEPENLMDYSRLRGSAPNSMDASASGNFFGADHAIQHEALEHATGVANPVNAPSYKDKWHVDSVIPVHISHDMSLFDSYQPFQNVKTWGGYALRSDYHFQGKGDILATFFAKDTARRVRLRNVHYDPNAPWNVFSCQAARIAFQYGKTCAVLAGGTELITCHKRDTPDAWNLLDTQPTTREVWEL
eukprot:jgi/Botrbrau1/3395/Bobra.0337s0035.2